MVCHLQASIEGRESVFLTTMDGLSRRLREYPAGMRGTGILGWTDTFVFFADGIENGS